ncbi:hypothetical protein FSP39_018296, partial [Pinctada imbricata]
SIRYDCKGILTGSFKDMTAEQVLLTKCCGHQGYCALFSAMCRTIGIPVRTISGYAKDDRNVEEIYTDITSCEPNHMWNVVHVEDEWRFVDCAWDTGYVSEFGKFVWTCNDFYFLTDPGFFAMKHLPVMDDDPELSQKWQLLEDPLDLETFSRNTIVHEFAMENGIGPVTHSEILVEVIGEVGILIRGPGKQLWDVFAEMEELHQFDNASFNQYVICERLGIDGIRIKVVPPIVSTFILTIFAKVEMHDEVYGKVATYIIKCLDISKNVKPFPEHGIWGPTLDYEEMGFDKAVAYDWKYEAPNGEIDIYIPVHTKMIITPKLHFVNDEGNDIENAVLVQTDSRSIVAIVRMARKGNYKLTICVKLPSGVLKPVVYYMINCRRALTPYKLFPLAFPIIQEFMVTLIEPKTRELPARSYVRFRLSSPIMTSIRIGQNTYCNPYANRWDVTTLTPGEGEELTIYGGTDTYRTSLFVYKIVKFERKPHVCSRFQRSIQHNHDHNSTMCSSDDSLDPPGTTSTSLNISRSTVFSLNSRK